MGWWIRNLLLGLILAAAGWFVTSALDITFGLKAWENYRISNSPPDGLQALKSNLVYEVKTDRKYRLADKIFFTIYRGGRILSGGGRQGTYFIEISGSADGRFTGPHYKGKPYFDRPHHSIGFKGSDGVTYKIEIVELPESQDRVILMPIYGVHS